MLKWWNAKKPFFVPPRYTTSRLDIKPYNYDDVIFIFCRVNKSVGCAIIGDVAAVGPTLKILTDHL